MHFIQHTNIVAMHAIVCEPGHYGLVMEYVFHGALDEFIGQYNVCYLVSDLFL